LKNSPARTRPQNRSRSAYSNPQRDGGQKIPYTYPAWVTQKRDPPPEILAELRLARGGR
jgi:hypothetical protein